MKIGYARVSTDAAEQDTSIDGQVRQLRAAGCDRVICERLSAFKEATRRPGWEELQSLVATRQASEVVACSMARLSRRDDVGPFLRMCSRLGVRVTLLDGTTADVADPAGRLMTGVLATVNEVDSLIKSVAVRNGLQRRREAGHYACGRVPFGYAYEGGRVVAHPERFEDARRLWDDLAAVEFNAPGLIRRQGLDWSHRGLHRWANNPILRGIVRGVPDACPALITTAEWLESRRMIEARRQRQTRAPRVIRPFSGLVRCGGCGNALHYHHAAGKPRLKCSRLTCRWWGRGLAEWKVRRDVLDALRLASERLADVAVQPEPERAPAGPEVAQLEQLLSLQASGVDGLEGAIAGLQWSITAQTASGGPGPDWGYYRELFRLPGVLELATDDELRAIVRELVTVIHYDGHPRGVRVEVRGAGGDGA